jgi:hypothetical protein
MTMLTMRAVIYGRVRGLAIGLDDPASNDDAEGRRLFPRHLRHLAGIAVEAIAQVTIV